MTKIQNKKIVLFFIGILDLFRIQSFEFWILRPWGRHSDRESYSDFEREISLV
jgi:hypothetical protein